MAKTKTKSGSKVKEACPVCGQVLTRAGMVGHMAWKHGKQSKAPLLPSKAMPRLEEKRKAAAYDDIKAHLSKAIGELTHAEFAFTKGKSLNSELFSPVFHELFAIAHSMGITWKKPKQS